MTMGMPALNHEQQQQAVERIQDLMKQGLSSGEAIAQVAKEIRENHDGERVHMLFDDNMSDD